MKLLKKILYRAYIRLSRIIHVIWVLLFPAWYARYYYKVVTGNTLNLKDPKDYNEKVQWLKVYSDISQWTDLADKYKVREYIEEYQLNNILVKLYGVWDRAEDIDFTLLPDKFVLKTNNGCGKNILVYDKKKLDADNTRETLSRWLNEKSGLVDFQPHMWGIKGCIIAEELLEDDYNRKLSSSLIDYKIFCFHGEPVFIDVIYDRNNIAIGSAVEKSQSIYKREKVYDLNWNSFDSVLEDPLPGDLDYEIPKPKCFDEMMEISRILSKPFLQVRVDLYEVNKKVYFGELTFTPGGMMDFNHLFLLKMGSLMDLSLAKKRNKLFII